MIKDIISTNKKLFSSHDDISLEMSITGANLLLGYFLRNCSLSLNTAFFFLYMRQQWSSLCQKGLNYSEMITEAPDKLFELIFDDFDVWSICQPKELII